MSFFLYTSRYKPISEVILANYENINIKYHIIWCTGIYRSSWHGQVKKIASMTN